MPYVANFELPGDEHLLSLINGVNNKNYTFAQIYFDPPEASALQVGPNTQCIVRAIPGSPYKGSTTIYYNRLDMNTLFTGLLDVALADGATLQQTLDQILVQYGLMMTVDDVEITQDNLNNYTITAKPGSFVFMGEVPLAYTGVVNPPVGDPLQITGYDGIGLTGYDNQTITFYAATA